MQVMCTDCNKGFKDEEYLKAHKDSKHAKETNLVPEFKGLTLDVCTTPSDANCDICG